MTVVDARRRKILAGGAAATALWVAPSVTTLDRVSAATGSCGTPGVQLDWSIQSNGSTPGTITAADGTEVTFTLVKARKPGSNNFTVRHITRGALDDMLYLEMSDGGDKDYIEIRIDFDTPVDLCFTLVDVDRSNNNWEDTVTVVGSDNGTSVPLGSTDIFLYGTGVSYVGTNTVRGVYSVGSGSNAANADVRFPAPVDQVVITYSDVSKWKTTQFVGIHDLRWC